MSKLFIFHFVICFHFIFLLTGNAQGPPPLPGKGWYYQDVNGTQRGPVDSSVISALIKTQSINTGTLIWTNGFSGWKSAGTVPEFVRYFGGSPTSPPTTSPMPISSYTARIGNRDKYSSKNAKLSSASEILKQDRANYHRFGKTDSEDQNDSHLTTSESRASANFSMSTATANAIVSGNPLVKVNRGGKGSYQVSIVSSSGPSQPSSPKPVGGYLAKIGNHDKHSSSNAKLSSASEILKQDRANYHRFNKRDSADQNDSYLTTSDRRASAKFSMSSSTAQSIVNGTPTVRVVRVNGVFQVSIVSY